MTHAKRLLLSLGATLLLWTLFSWPLPRHVFEAIPASSQNVEKDHRREMIPGDHLQLLYHFELLHGMLAGRTPWFHNVYEFNTGSDSERLLPTAYYAPFSLLYSAFVGIAGQAFAWNLVGFVSLWLTYWLTWWLTRRHVHAEITAALAAIISILLPYRWVNLLGGSPTGFAMIWVPAVWLGLDMATREDRRAGGVLAGAALLLLCWADLQSFFFCGLAAPFWIVLALVPRWPEAWRDPDRRRRIGRALLPIAAFLVLVVLYRWMRHHHLAGADLAARRGISEVSNFSPAPWGLFRWASFGLESHLYMGFLLPLVLLVGLGSLWRRDNWESRERRRSAVIFLMLCAAMVFAILLALGVQGPLGGRLLTVVRLLIPPYSLLRQSAKIFCLMPTFLAVGVGLAVEIAVRKIPTRKSAAVLWILLAGLVVEMRGQVRPTLCVLAHGQGAYAAVADDARAAGDMPRAVALPIWPGQDAYGSIYEFYSQRYGLRMVNGYSPVVRRAYVRDVYEKLRSFNQGWIPDAVLEDLLQRDVRYILLHENLFPEQVSPFPVTTTLTRLQQHPRLDFLAHAETVWAFRIRPAPRGPIPERGGPDCAASFPARRWEMETSTQKLGRIVSAPDASAGEGLALEQPGARVETASTMMSPAPGLRWMVRARGHGRLRAYTLADGHPLGPQAVAVAADSWTWQELSASGLTDFTPLALRLEHEAGAVEVDLTLLAAGEWKDLAPGERLNIPAPCFFHGGYTDSEQNNVELHAASDPCAAILYGPKLPFATGRYAVEFFSSSSAPEGTDLGRLYVEGQDENDWTPVRAGPPSVRLEWDQETNLPVNLVFVYLRNADMTIKSIALERLASDSP